MEISFVSLFGTRPFLVTACSAICSIMLMMTMRTPIAVIVPTRNAARDWPAFASALAANVGAGPVMIMDSSSTDGTAELAYAEGFRVYSVPVAEFNHGGTRQLAVDLL